MTSALALVAAQLSLAVLGAGAGFHPSVRSMSVAGRAALSMGAGAVALTVEATLFSLAGIPWTVPGLASPLCAISVACAMRWRKLPSPPRRPLRVSRLVLVGCGLVSGAALLFLALSFGSSAATSTDFLLFWGVKAVRFADALGISADFLRNPFTLHAVPDYPPLLPIVQAWGCLVVGKMPWRSAPVISAIWLAASIPIVLERLRRALRDDEAASLTSFWTVALSVSLAYSYSGGNAEAPLLFFETVALVWLMTEQGPSESRFIPVMALCGAGLTKVEGSVAVALLAAGAFLQSVGRGRARSAARALVLAAVPAAAVGTWFLYQASRRLPVGYRTHGVLFGLHPAHSAGVAEAMLRCLNAGSLWMPWILSLSLLLAFPAAWRRVLSALLLAGGLLVFFFFDYLHDVAVPGERIGWTLPRISQPPLSAAILAAGLASLWSGSKGSVNADGSEYE